MLLSEWNWDDAKRVWQEEAREDTWEKAQKRERELFALWESGVPLPEAKKKLGLS